ncbi:hypothetical protein KAU33_03450 [Candidatus Dependentiae bacterium]|nr:hypothetical protein [Candidatus Dependentiae bacterium]
MNLEKEICNEIKAIPQKLYDKVFPRISIYILPESFLNMRTYDLDEKLINVTFGPFGSEWINEDLTDDYERYRLIDNGDEKKYMTILL